MTQPGAPPKTEDDPAPHPLKEGGVKTGREHEKKSFNDSADASPPTEAPPAPEVFEEGGKPERGREGGMINEG